MANWPDFMPAPEFGSISVGAPIGAVVRTEMEVGPAKQRKRYTAVPRPVSLAFEPMTEANIAAFDNFYEQDLSMGALSFEMPHPVTDAPSKFRFAAHEEAWSYVPIGKNAYRLTVQMELLP